MSYFVLAAVSGLATLAAAEFAVSGLGYRLATGAYRARAFDIRRPPPLARELIARLTGGLAPVLVPVLLFWVALSTGGEQIPTNQVTINEGPARRAGMLDGDRIVAIDGHPTKNWEEVRQFLQAGHTHDPKGRPSAVRVIDLERVGGPISLSIAPDGGGYLRVVPINRRARLGPLLAARGAFASAWRIISDLIRVVPDKDSTTIGPVGIVAETSKQTDLAEFLWFVACIGAYFAPAFLVGHFLDAASLKFFLGRNPEATAARDEAHRRPWRLARLRQLLHVAIVVYAVSSLLWLVSGAPTGAILFIQVWFCPVLPTLVWILTRDRSGRVPAALSLLAMAVPLLNLFIAWRASANTDTFLRNNGLRQTWLGKISQTGG